MIPRVHPRGKRVGGLIRYVYGPGKREEHTDPHIVAAWDGAGDLSALEPTVGLGGARDFRDLIARLEQPVRAGRQPPALTVWHCSVRNHDTDRVLTDEQWRHIAGEVMAGVGLAPHSDDGAVRWIAVRHADNHIHLVATLVRQDGRTAWGWQDKRKSREVCADLEQRYGLWRVAPSDRTGVRHPSSAEVSKARRQGRARTPREELRHRVRAVVAASVSEEEFFGRLRDAGVQVDYRYSSRDPGQRTGYKVALANHRGADGELVWYSGGKLAADLTLPKLRARWSGPDAYADRAGGPVRISPAARAQTLAQASETVRAAAEQMRAAAHLDPDAAQAIAQAAADTLAAVASAAEGRRGGPLTRAAELFDRAARPAHARVVPATSRSYQLRAMSRLVALMGRVSGDEDTFAVLALVLDLARLGDTLANLRDAQQRWHQAEAARQAAAALRTAAGSGSVIGVPVPAGVAGGPRAQPDTAATAATTEQVPDKRQYATRR